MKQQTLLAALSILFLGGIAGAQDLCLGVKSCLKLKAKVDSRIQELAEPRDFRQDPYGNIILDVIQPEAHQICSSLVTPSRLPTARELAMSAVHHGRAALIEAKDFKRNNTQIPTGYEPKHFIKVKTLETDGTSDEFYYASTFYSRPKGPLSRFKVWSSSVNFDDPKLPFYFDGYWGYLKSGSLTGYVEANSPVRTAVRCMEEPKPGICSSINQCKNLSARVDRKLRASVEFSLQLKDENGQILKNMDQPLGETLCEGPSFGTRLPTARELAMAAVINHRAALIEVKDFNDENFVLPYVYRKEGFVKISTKELDGTTDEFYYSSDLYVGPKEYQNTYKLWSSSVDLQEPEFGFYFDELTGAITPKIKANKDPLLTARCAPIRKI